MFVLGCISVRSGGRRTFCNITLDEVRLVTLEDLYR